MAAVGGVVTMTIDGTTYRLGESLSFSPFATVKTPVNGLQGNEGYSETGVSPSVEVELVTNSDLSMSALESLSEATIEIQLRNGSSYILSGAFVEGEPSVDAASGKVSITLRGREMTEVQ